MDHNTQASPDKDTDPQSASLLRTQDKEEEEEEEMRSEEDSSMISRTTPSSDPEDSGESPLDPPLLLINQESRLSPLPFLTSAPSPP